MNAAQLSTPNADYAAAALRRMVDALPPLTEGVRELHRLWQDGEADPVLANAVVLRARALLAAAEPLARTLNGVEAPHNGD